MAQSCHMALDTLRQEMNEAWWWCTYQDACCHGMIVLLSLWTAVTAKERDVVRGNNKWKGSVAGQSGVEEEWEGNGL